MEEKNEWTAEVINFVHKTLSSDVVHVTAISDNNGFIGAKIIVNSISYNPPLFWVANDIYFNPDDGRLNITMEINVSDLFKLMV
jgi:hypothetical protein